MKASHTMQAQRLRQNPVACPMRLPPRSAGMRHARRAQQTDASPASSPGQMMELPRNAEAMLAQAIESAKICRAPRQRVELLNPVNEKSINFMSTEALDYPCSNMAEFNSIVSLARRFMAGVAGAPDETAVKMKRIDEGGIDGDLIMLMRIPGFACMVWPTAEKIKDLEKLANDPSVQMTFIINPQWKAEGNLVSEFGIFPWDRQKNEGIANSFMLSYGLCEQRIGAPSSVANLATGTRYASGGVVRVLSRAQEENTPGEWAVHVVAPDGSSQIIGACPSRGAGGNQRPTYAELEQLINAARASKAEIFNVAAQASAAIDKAPPPPTDRDSATFYTRDQILNMDQKQLRRVLTNLTLPTSGAMPKLQARALAVVDAIEAEQPATLEQAVESARRLK